MEELPIDLVHEILPDFTRIPARAIACTIAEVNRLLIFQENKSLYFLKLDITTQWTRRLDKTSNICLCFTL
jgi:hypothetical protein